MDIEKVLKENQLEVVVDEDEIQTVVDHSVDTFIKREREQILSYHEFICEQFRLIKKRWWILQFALLWLAWYLLATGGGALYIRREMGILGTLFIILMIPELWKNLTNRCMEIESAAYYSVQKIYAARIILFGLMDILMLTIFSGSVHVIVGIPLREIVTEFLLPMTVTACICFSVLGRQYRNSGIAMVLCVIWSAVWWAISANDLIYAAVALPVWMSIFGMAILFLIVMIYRLLRSCNKYMEVNYFGDVFN